MNSGLYTALFVDELSDGSPPFENRQRLASKISELPGYSGKSKSVAAQLGQLINGNRPPSKRLGEAVLSVFKIRIAHEPEERQLILTAKLCSVFGRTASRINSPYSRVHLAALAEQDTPDQRMVDMLNRVELAAGFPLGIETCRCLLADYAVGRI